MVFKDCKLIVWDECTMAHKGTFQALNRTLKEIRDNTLLMEGITVLGIVQFWIIATGANGRVRVQQRIQHRSKQSTE